MRSLVLALVLTLALGASGGPAWHPDGLIACPSEDWEGACYWDAQGRGNGLGESFWVDSNGVMHKR